MEKRQGENLPTRMCELLAAATHDAIQHRWTQTRQQEEWALPDEYHDFYIPLDPYLDFQRSTDCMTHRHLRPE